MDRLVFPGRSNPERLFGRGLIDLILTSAILLAGCSASGDDDESGNLKGGGNPAPAPVISLTASPSSVAINGSSSLTWSVTNATSCEAAGAWSGGKALSDSQTVGPLTQMFNLPAYLLDFVKGCFLCFVDTHPPERLGRIGRQK